MYRSLPPSNPFATDAKFMDHQLRVTIVLAVLGIRLNNHTLYCLVLASYLGAHGQRQSKLSRSHDHVKSLSCECLALELFKNLEVKVPISITVISFDKRAI